MLSKIIGEMCVRENPPCFFKKQVLGLRVTLRQMVQIQHLHASVACHAGGLRGGHVADFGGQLRIRLQKGGLADQAMGTGRRLC